MNEPSRLLGIYWEPKPVFEDLAERPRFWVPIVLLTILSIVFLYFFSNVVGWENMMRQEIESSARLEQLSVEQKERIIEQQMKFVPIFGYVGGTLGTLITLLVIAAALLGLFKMGGGAELTFKQAFSVCSYSYLPMLLHGILAIVVMHFADPRDFDIRNPVAVNLAWVLDKQATPKWLYAASGSVDLFAIWVALLIALGLSVAAKRTFGKSLTLVLIGWGVFIVLKSGWAAIFG